MNIYKVKFIQWHSVHHMYELNDNSGQLALTVYRTYTLAFVV